MYNNTYMPRIFVTVHSSPLSEAVVRLVPKSLLVSKGGNIMSVYSAHIDTFARDNLPPRDQWPDLIFTIPEVQYPDRLNCIVELLDTKVLQGYGDHPAIFSADGVLTYAQLQAQVDKVAHVLTHDMGLVPSNRVLLRSANNAMLAVCLCAVAKARLIVPATMTLLRGKELVEILS